MSVYSEKYIKRSQKNRRCVGCDNFVTIRAGDPYYSCWFAKGGDAGSYAMCEPCHDHLQDCDSCQEYMRDTGEVPYNIRECREEQGREAERKHLDDMAKAECSAVVSQPSPTPLVGAGKVGE